MAFAWTLVFLVLQGGHSYILLTANLDDVHTIAKQMAASPVASQLNRILRRASNIFNQQLQTGNDGNNRRSLLSQLRSTDLSFKPLQENHIERQNRQDQQPHRRHRQNGTDDDRHHHSYRLFADSENLTKSYNEDTHDQDHIKHESQQSIDKSRPREREPRDNLEENNEAQGEDKAIQEDTHERSGELEDRRKESHQWEERADDIKVQHKKLDYDDSKVVTHEKGDDDGIKIVSPEKRYDDDIKVVRHENRDVDARSHPDEDIFQRKNASFFLNAIKNIMETV